jgi:predicted lipoprotein with Yx(FWY)xxD motif
VILLAAMEAVLTAEAETTLMAAEVNNRAVAAKTALMAEKSNPLMAEETNLTEANFHPTARAQLLQQRTIIRMSAQEAV